ncbi:EutN/CcmL family microcompartment protein [Paenibacillus donghaensis]|uniref:Ethanolamine utilization protein EutN n=1 Tax=Paenibacillus donghaensis TaxID=414771 RepID=A0A2Z2KL75_9BACL|nr:EutN/CcmL family microcompartment protein [Paenibacillus donghaensis]ASA24113.1 ethanolamine utilization protein EutN [Paenibacillus donghaensis]
MQLGLIIGHVVATRKDEALVGAKLLVIQPIQPDHTPMGPTIVAVDTVGAGIGETIIFVVGSVASRATPHPEAPIDAAIVGIVDSVDCAKSGGS